MIELCGRCQHTNDHVGKACDHPANSAGDKCKCPSGIRSDVFANEQLAVLCDLARLNTRILLIAHGLEIRPNGDIVKTSGLVGIDGQRV